MGERQRTLRQQCIKDSLQLLSNTLYKVSQDSKQYKETCYTSEGKQWTRLKRMLEMKDSRSLWKGIDWRGDFREIDTKEQPP